LDSRSKQTGDLAERGFPLFLITLLARILELGCVLNALPRRPDVHHAPRWVWTTEASRGAPRLASVVARGSRPIHI